MGADDISDRVMDVLAVHRQRRYNAFASDCSCGWADDRSDFGAYRYDRHLADAIAKDIADH